MRCTHYVGKRVGLFLHDSVLPENASENLQMRERDLLA